MSYNLTELITRLKKDFKYAGSCLGFKYETRDPFRSLLRPYSNRYLFTKDEVEDLIRLAAYKELEKRGVVPTISLDNYNVVPTKTQ